MFLQYSSEICLILILTVKMILKYYCSYTTDHNLFNLDFNGENASTILTFFKSLPQTWFKLHFNSGNATTMLMFLQYSSEISLSLFLTLKMLLKY